MRLPASADPEIFAAQQTMIEAWSVVRDNFVDDSKTGGFWEDALKRHLTAAYRAPDARAAFGEIGTMLQALGDPYTRILPPAEYDAFRVASDGEVHGVGLLIANDPTGDGHLRVLAPLAGGPADRAGIRPGDELVAIDGQPLRGVTSERASSLLRGSGGTEVRVRLVRRSDGIPGVPGRPEPAPQAATTTREVRLRREPIALSPLFYTLVAPGAGTARQDWLRSACSDVVFRTGNCCRMDGTPHHVAALYIPTPPAY